MSPVPARKRVRAETGVNKRYSALHEIGFKVKKIGFKLPCNEHALVNYGSGRKTGYVERLVAPRGLYLRLSALSYYVEPSLEIVSCRSPISPADEYLPYPRFAPKCGRAQRGIVGRNVPPSQNGLPLLGDYILKSLFCFLLNGRIGGKEYHSDSVILLRREGYSLGSKNINEERMGFLKQYPGSVSRIRLASAGPAVLKVFEHSYGLAYYSI